MEFLKNNKRFSFVIGETNAWDTPYDVSFSENGNELTTVYVFQNGLKVTNIAKKYDDFDAYEWVNWLENTSDAPTEIISDLWDADCSLPMMHEDPKQRVAYFPDVKKATKVYAPAGSTCAKTEFYCDVDIMNENTRLNHIYPGETKSYSAFGGRSSGGEHAPFFNVHKEGTGYIFAIGWTGQWNCEITREEDSLTFRSKVEDTHFRLLPGEKIRTSSVVFMGYAGDFADSQNKWRRLVKKHFSLIGSKGRPDHGPLCAGVWGGMKTSSILERLDVLDKEKLPFEYIWMDAGWYGIDTKPTPDEYEGDWAEHTGDWRVSPLIHPNKLKDVTEKIHAGSRKFILWFEPERVISTTPIAQEHPEYFIPNPDPNVPDWAKKNWLLDLGNPDAWEYCLEAVSTIIEELSVDFYRQDFNFKPLHHWRSHDAEDRKGITEIKHITGLYRFWDALLKRFPHLLIDNCASGGRRLDIETMRRSMPLWRSDAQCPANFDEELSQCHNQTFTNWMPFSGTSTGRSYDSYRSRSCYGASLTTNYTFSERNVFGDDPEKIAFLRKHTEEYLKIRPYFTEDFYALTELSTGLDTWCVLQFNRPEQGDGLLEVFVREEAPYETARFQMRGIREDKDYLFTDLDGGEFTVSGKEIKEKGVQITVLEKRTAKLYIYKEI